MRSFALALAIAGVEAHGGYVQPTTHFHGYAPTPGHYHAQAYNSGLDAWATGATTVTPTVTPTVIDKSKWYSPYQQYSPIRIPYVPADHPDT